MSFQLTPKKPGATELRVIFPKSNFSAKGESEMPSSDILEQGQRRREVDKSRIPKLLQENQQKFESKKHRKTLILAVIAIIISVLSLLFDIFTYYGIIPSHKTTSNPSEQHDKTKATHTIIDKHKSE